MAETMLDKTSGHIDLKRNPDKIGQNPDKS